LLRGDLIGSSALLLLVVKAVIWSVALGSGTSGGVLAPLLIMGGALGALFGMAVPSGEAGIWALVGMASMMGGTMRSPLTAMIFAIELTHNTGGLLPLAIGCATAHGTTVLLLKRSILTEKVARRGHHVVREYIVDPFETMRVGDIMARPVDTLPASMQVREAVAFFTAPDAPPRHKSYPAVDAAGELVAMVSRADTLRWTVAGWPAGRLLGQQLAGQEPVIGYDDELVGPLADRMAETGTGRVPILRRSDKSVIGLVARRDLLLVRARVIHQEREREALLRPRAGRTTAPNRAG
jgi:CIC family chloride channel protein